jgi:acyl carrier protein
MSNTKKTELSLLERLFGRRTNGLDQPPTREQIQAWLIARLAKHLQLVPEDIDVRESFNNYGLDSRTAVGLSGELERWLRRPLPPTLAWDYPTIELIARFLTEETPPPPAEFDYDGQGAGPGCGGSGA